MHSFPAGSAPGLSGLRASHIKEAISYLSPMQASAVLQALAKFINVLSSDNVPPVIIPYLCGASLVAIPKKNGGVHPIAIGDVLHCLASKCILHLVISEARCYLDPRHVGVGVPIGAEAIIHSIRSIESSSIPPNNKWCLQLDFTNAFNCISREHICEEARLHVPSYSAVSMVLSLSFSTITTQSPAGQVSNRGTPWALLPPRLLFNP